MTNPIHSSFQDWFNTYIYFDLDTKLNSKELYDHYSTYTTDLKILALRRKSFVKECKILLEPAIKNGRVEVYYTNCVNFRGISFGTKEKLLK